MPQSAQAVELRAETVKAFAAYVRQAEADMDAALQASALFLWAEQNQEQWQRVREGEIVAQFWSGSGPVKVPKGLIHDWVGSALIAGATLDQTLAVIQDYENHKNIYSPEVIESKLLDRDGNDFRIYLRLLKKKIITVVLDTEHEVHYRCLDRTRWLCRSYTTRISEVQDAGSPKEKVLPPDSGYGFLWRLYSYWQFEQRKEGVYVECRAISLTRDVPFGMGWMIEPIIQKLPKESLISTLKATRRALQTTKRK
jgi:hypothetical protein